jgi:hypothetical protein
VCVLFVDFSLVSLVVGWDNWFGKHSYGQANYYFLVVEKQNFVIWRKSKVLSLVNKGCDFLL